MPRLVRILNAICGFILIGLASTVFWLPQVFFSLMIIFLGIAFFFLGISRILNGALEKSLTSRQRMLDIVFGLILIALSVPVMFSNILGGILWILLLAITLIVFGLNLLITGVFSPAQWTRFRTLEIAGGTLATILGVTVVVFPQLGAITLLFFLAFGMAYAGIYLIIVGIIGQ